MQDYPGAGEVALPRVTMFLYLTDTRNSAAPAQINQLITQLIQKKAFN